MNSVSWSTTNPARVLYLDPVIYFWSVRDNKACATLLSVDKNMEYAIKRDALPLRVHTAAVSIDIHQALKIVG